MFAAYRPSREERDTISTSALINRLVISTVLIEMIWVGAKMKSLTPPLQRSPPVEVVTLLPAEFRF